MPAKKKAPDMFMGRPVYAIDRFARLKPMKDKLDERHGIGQWGRPEAVALMTERDQLKAKEIQAATGANIAMDASRVGRIEKIVKNYQRTFKDVTPNDAVLLAEMAEIEISLGELSGRKYETVAETKAAGELRIKYIQQHQKIQVDLNIARSQREGERDVDATLREFVSRSRALVAKRAIPILCPKCVRAKRKINLGFILFHFDGQTTYHWSCICPQCGAAVDIVGEVDPSKVRPPLPPELEPPVEGETLEVASEPTG